MAAASSQTCLDTSESQVELVDALTAAAIHPSGSWSVPPFSERLTQLARAQARARQTFQWALRLAARALRRQWGRPGGGGLP